MRKSLVFILGVFSLVACSREVLVSEPENIGDESTKKVTFHAVPMSTRAQFGEAEDGVRPTLWSENDTEVKLSLNYGSALAAGVTPSQDFTSASFSANVNFSGVSGPYTFYAVSPSASAKALSPSREAWKVNIPCEQTPTAMSPDENAIIIAASSEEFSSSQNFSDVDLYFYHLTAYGRVSLKNFTPTSGETLEAVELTFTEPLVGDWYWKCTEEAGGHELIDYGTSSTVTIHTSSASDIWFGCAPVDVSGAVLVVRAFTSEGVYEKMTQFPANRKLNAGRVAVFSVNMNGADFTAAGSGGSGTPVSVSMSTFDTVSGSVDGDENVSYEATQGDAQTAPVVNGGEIRIYQNGGLLTVTANNGKTISNVTIGSSMATSVQVRMDSGSFGSSNSISAGGTYSTGTISASTVVFKCTGTDKSHRLYLNYLSVTYSGDGSGGTSTEDPMLERSVYGCWLGGGNDWEYNPGSDQMTRSYSSAGVLTFTLINADDIEELEISGYKKSYVKGDDVTITVNWRRGLTTVHHGTYDMTVVKEDGPKVWLGDGSGKGFIIKK